MTTKADTGRCRFEAADVLLVHTKHSLWGWLIRAGTHCYWNHALMVCRTGKRGGSQDTLVVDARSDGSIMIGPVGIYLDRPGKYDVAVMRLEIGHLSPAAGPALRSNICDVAVNEVNVKVGLPLIGSLERLGRQFTLIARFIRRKIRRFARPPALPWSVRPAEVKAFTCGGFVQWCYYQAARRMVAGGSAGDALLEHVRLNMKLGPAPTPFELLTTTPADIAGSDKLCWRYVIRDGVVQESTTTRASVPHPVAV